MGMPKTEKSEMKNNSKKVRSKVFKHRKDGIFKKAWELSTLCDVPVGVIIFGPDEDSPEVWPKDSGALTDILFRYQNSNVGACSGKKSAVSTNKSAAINPDFWTEKIDNFSDEELVELVGSLEFKIDAINNKINFMKKCEIAPLFEEVGSYNAGVPQEKKKQKRGYSGNFDYENALVLERRKNARLMMMMTEMMMGMNDGY